MTIPLAAAGPSPMWFLSRGTGIVTLLLLTASVTLGIVNTRRWGGGSGRRFVIDGLHRNVSLLVVAFLSIHVAATLADSFAPIALRDAVIPFAATYRPIWVGLGALALDLLAAVAITSVVRRRLGYAAWRRVHWLAYACWPVALLHGLGTGTDTTAPWVLALSIACVVAVWSAAWTRVSASHPAAGGPALAGFAALVLGPLALGVWLPRGPLGSAWARRAGTPAALLASASGGSRRGSPSTVLAVPFTSQLSGTLRRGETADGLAAVDLAMTFGGRSPGAVDVRIQGEPASGGGVSMTASRVVIGPRSAPGAYRGRIVSLDGQHVLATATDSAGRALRLELALDIDPEGRNVGGTIRAEAEARA